MISLGDAAFIQHVPCNLRQRSPAIGVSSYRVGRRAKVQIVRRARIRVEAAAVSSNGAPPLEPHSAKKVGTSRPLLRFIRLAWTEWRLLVPALLSALLASCISIFLPILYGRILSTLAFAHTLSFAAATQKLVRRVSAIGTAYCFEVIGTLLFVSFMSKVAQKATRRLREQVFAASFRNDVGFFDETGRLAVEEALTKEIEVVRNKIWGNLSKDRGLRALLEVSLGMMVCFTVTRRVGAPVFGVLVPIVAIIVAQLGLRNGRIGSRVAEKESDIKGFVNEKLHGLRTLKVFGAEAKEMSALNRLMDTTAKSARKFAYSMATTEAANRVAIYLTIITLFLYGGGLVCKGVIEFEQFSSMTGYLWLFNFAMQGISYTIRDLSILRSSLQRIYALIDKAESYRSLTKAALLPADQLPTSFQGQVRFHNVHFHYPSRPDVTVLKGIDFAIQPGKTVALTGSSGGGKSTIAAMLSRFYAPTEGTVTLDGIDVQTFSTEVYAEQISLVDQEPVLFQGTIRENIAYGANSDSLSDEAIVRAAEEANAHDFIMKLPEKYDTVWTAGSNLSGGQKQRIAIARSLVKSPRVLLLDEATSALDQESERAVQNALDRLMKHRTVLIIAHRLSTVRSADTILFINNGEVEESGTYDELVKRPKGKFRALVEAAMQKMETSTERSVI